MSEQDRSNILVFQEPNSVRAKSFKIKSQPENITAFRNTVRAFIDAGMPLEQIANAGDFLGEEVERLETDAPLQNGWQHQRSEIVEDENQIFAWQSRGETVTLDHQLTAANPETGREVVIISKELSTHEHEPGTINVVEGISVTRNAPEAVDTNHDAELESSPFLQPLKSGN